MHLACISPVDDLDPFLSCQAIHINLVGVPAAMPLLLGPAILEVELHLHLIYTLDKIQKYFTGYQYIYYQLQCQTVQHALLQKAFTMLA